MTAMQYCVQGSECLHFIPSAVSVNLILSRILQLSVDLLMWERGKVVQKFDALIVCEGAVSMR
jgi:hypothetical protein